MSFTSPVARAVARTGGLVFVIALGAGAYAYLVPFAVVPAPWASGAGVRAVAIDALLFSGFALHHSVFARMGVKRLVESAVAPGLERSCYVWAASVLFLALLWWWVPVPGVLWNVRAPLSWTLYGVQLCGLVLTAYASGRLGVMALAGIPQAAGHVTSTPAALRTTGVYGLVRHPIYLAWVLMVWPTPLMTGSRLTFAVVSTFYLMVAVPIEERSLVREFGQAYRAYQRMVRWRIVPFLY